MSMVEQVLVTWRRTRRNVSEHRETNIAAWLVELQHVLAEYGLDARNLCGEESLHDFVEKEYDAYKPRAGN